MKLSSVGLVPHLALAATLFLTAGLPSSACGQGAASAVTPPTKETQSAMTPDSALAELKSGNARFVAGQSVLRDAHADVKTTAAGQYPFAIVLSCVDSRVP